GGERGPGPPRRGGTVPPAAPRPAARHPPVADSRHSADGLWHPAPGPRLRRRHPGRQVRVRLVTRPLTLPSSPSNGEEGRVRGAIFSGKCSCIPDRPPLSTPPTA